MTNPADDDLFTPAELEALLKGNGEGLKRALSGETSAPPPAFVEGMDTLRALRVTRGRKRQRAINISDEAYEGLKAVAESRGIVWGGDGNVSELMELLGMGLLHLTS